VTALGHLVLASSGSVQFFRGWKFTGDFTAVDLLAAGANALNGALLARRPDHYKNFTHVGIILMGLLAGLSGGIVRDVLLGNEPGALTNPAYVTVAFVGGVVGYQVAYAQGQLFREGAFQLVTSLSLVWFAIVGAQAGTQQGIPVIPCIMLAMVAATAGRWLVDVSCGVTPKQFIRGEWFVTIAALTALIWLATDAVTDNTWIALAVASVIGFIARSLALFYGWEEPLASEPHGVYEHANRRPLLGRKLQGKSRRELHDLGLTVETNGSGGSASVVAGTRVQEAGVSAADSPR
jgi:uncharacterized membrane protein YeiH